MIKHSIFNNVKQDWLTKLEQWECGISWGKRIVPPRLHCTASGLVWAAILRCKSKVCIWLYAYWYTLWSHGRGGAPWHERYDTQPLRHLSSIERSAFTFRSSSSSLSPRQVTKYPSSSRRWFIMTDLETAKRRDSSTFRDESANVHTYPQAMHR